MRSQAEFDAAKTLIVSGCSDSKITQMTGIPRRTISAWRRGENRYCKPRRVACTGETCQGRDLSKLDPVQYSYLLGLYLGDGCLAAGRRNVWCLRISLDAAYPGIIKACASRKAFVRGLIHSDGTRIVAIEKKGSYERRAARYAFSNRSEDIKGLFCENLDALGIQWTRPSNRQIAIYRKQSVALMDEFVGPKR